MNIFEILFYQPIYNVLIILYNLLGQNLGLAIIAVAFLFRLLIVPLTLKQIKLAEMNKEMQSKVEKIKKQYKNNLEKQQQEMLTLQKEYLPQQLSGCLPLIFQFILFINLYNVINSIIADGIEGFNKVAYSFAPKFSPDFIINTDFFGIINLKETATSIMNTYGAISLEILPYILLILGVGITQFASMQILSAMRKKTETEKETKKKSKKKQKDSKDKTNPESFEEIFKRSTNQTMYILPGIVMVFSFGLPSGLSLYWITQSAFVIIQQYVFDFIKNRKKVDEIATI